MGETSIEWCHYTLNGWWGCVEDGPECARCYARDLAKRYGHKVWGKDAPRRVLGEDTWKKPLKWAKEAVAAGERRRVFCGSMKDICEQLPDGHPQQAQLGSLRARVFELAEETGHALDWLFLTKRPGNANEMMPATWRRDPPFFAWWGTTCGTPERTDRIDDLVRIRARTRFLSMEPLLARTVVEPWLRSKLIHWVIVGAEQTNRAPRPMLDEWVAEIRDWCLASGTSFFYKQQMEGRRKVSLPIIDGRQWAEFPDGRADG